MDGDSEAYIATNDLDHLVVGTGATAITSAIAGGAGRAYVALPGASQVAVVDVATKTALN